MGAGRLGVAAWLVAAGLLAGCGSSGDEEGDGPATTPPPSSTPVTAAADLADTTYESTSVEGHELASSEPIRVSFDGATLSVSAGCNTVFGPFDLTDDTLAWVDEPASTMLGCEPELSEQDQWLTELFTAGVEPTSDGSTLTLTSGDVVIELADVARADLDELLGKTWTVRATIADGTTRRISREVRNARLVVGQDGLARLDAGCNAGRTTVTIDEDAITFGPPALTRKACTGPARELERAVLAVVDGRSDSVSWEPPILVVVKGDQGLVFDVR